jgi:hypothetical protein
MRLEVIAALLLAGCSRVATYELVGCPASDGWTYEDHVKLAGEFRTVEACCPETARALTEYSELKPDRCAHFSGLRERD